MPTNNEIETGMKISNVLITPSGAKSTYDVSAVLQFLEDYNPEWLLICIYRLISDYAVCAGYSTDSVESHRVAENISLVDAFCESLLKTVETRKEVAA